MTAAGPARPRARSERVTIERVAGRDLPVHEVGARRLVSLWALAGDDEGARSALRLQHGRAVVRFVREGGAVLEGVPVDVAETILRAEAAS